MMTSPPRGLRSSAALLALLLIIAALPLPAGRLRLAIRNLRSPDPNRADREATATGYYVGLIDGGADSGRDELTTRLLGKTADWKSFHEIDATRYLEGDPLQFELKRSVRESIFGRAFTTNASGLRDREYALAKPEGTFRIALLGSSIDMGWGVGTDETYENLLEDWLNAHAARRGLKRRFQVVNFAMAAYSPVHRLETFRRKVRAYRPDLVLYSATMLDARLLEIHVRNLIREGIDPGFPFLRDAIAAIGAERGRRDGDKDALKARVRPHLDGIADSTLAELANLCREQELPLALLIVPRVGPSDAPDARAPGVAKLESTATRLGLPLLDLSATFDDSEPARIEIAPWDDHPNALGHKLLFEALARRIASDAALYRLLFSADPPR